MDTNKKIVAIIPARGGSVRVPLKNIKPLAGKPLIAYTIEAALKSQYINRVIVSTDHDEIANISKQYGAEVPFRRPSDISEDVSTELVLQHAIKFLEETENYSPDIIVLLQPTSPLRTTKSIDEVIKKMLETDADSVVTVTDVEGNRPEWMLSLDESNKVFPYATPFKEDGVPIIKLIARQEFPKLYKQNGAVYVCKRDLIMNKCQVIGKNSYAVIMNEEEAIDIDTATDFDIVEAMLKLKLKGD